MMLQHRCSFHFNCKTFFREQLFYRTSTDDGFWMKDNILKGALSNLRQLLATKSPLKMMKNAFYFTLKAFFSLTILKFLFWLFGHAWKWLDKKEQVNFRIYDATTWLTIAIQVLPNISRSKCNQTVKFGQLIECNIRNIFLEKSCTCVVEKLFSDPFIKNHYWAYLWVNSLKYYTVCFGCMPSWRLSKYIETKLQTTCFYLI